MKSIYIYSIILLLGLSQITLAQRTKTDANVFGHVISKGEHIPFATITVKGTTIGVISDETGHYELINLPLGELTIVASVMGYKTQEYTFVSVGKTSKEINFLLEEDVFNLDEVVVSANRSQQKRTQAPVIVNTISPAVFNTSQSVTIGEGMNFTPGLRLENNCQNCGFCQVRMNGMEGPYSQILINSRPVFSGLAGVYGLELIPSSIIERIEVVRGGGSALYGSNAIAGTINLILKDPLTNTYEVGYNNAVSGVGIEGTGDLSPDKQVNLNASIVSNDQKSGVTLFGFTRDRDPFDANGDSFSEISEISNLTLGARLFHRFGYRDKISVDFFKIKEERAGGNKFDYPFHERDIAEAVNHNLRVASLTFDKFFRELDLLSVYISGQALDRSSYYGAEQSLSDYGRSADRTYNLGMQYKAQFSSATLVGGVESTGGFLVDEKLGYPDIDNALTDADTIVSVPHTDNIVVADQNSFTTGLFIQYDINLGKASLALGGRYDIYRINDRVEEGSDEVSGSVFSPRINIKYDIIDKLKARVSYSKGYRAPQIFDEDLHIETSGSRQVLHRNDPGLVQETSQSYMASLDYNGVLKSARTGLLFEVFYTRLNDPFVNSIGNPDDEGTVIYTRTNAEGGATVKGINIELLFVPSSRFSLSSGFTLQDSKYDEEQEFGERHFFRSPDSYGYITMDWDIVKKICLSASGNYSGKMLVPYFGPESGSEAGELRESDNFFDLGMKLKYNVKLNGASLQFFTGVRNILNAYQSDFDSGINRDPSYIYGPVLPRTIYMGVKFGNFLDKD